MPDERTLVYFLARMTVEVDEEVTETPEEETPEEEETENDG